MVVAQSKPRRTETLAQSRRAEEKKKSPERAPRRRAAPSEARQEPGLAHDSQLSRSGDARCASSSGVEARPSTLLRCGKRDEALDDGGVVA
jgi:hypothetical protein